MSLEGITFYDNISSTDAFSSRADYSVEGKLDERKVTFTDMQSTTRSTLGVLQKKVNMSTSEHFSRALRDNQPPQNTLEFKGMTNQNFNGVQTAQGQMIYSGSNNNGTTVSGSAVGIVQSVPGAAPTGSVGAEVSIKGSSGNNF